MKIIFQDVDGPLIPLRMYYTRERRFDMQTGSFLYDPVAVGMLNHICQQFDAKVVFNSAHCDNPEENMRRQGLHNGFDCLHPTECTTEFVRSIPHRYRAIEDWLSRHPEVTDWIVIDDIEVYRPRQVLIDYKIGMTINSYYQACELFGQPQPPIIGVGQTHSSISR